MQIMDMVNGVLHNAVAFPKNSQNNVQANTAFEMLLSEAGRRRTPDPMVEHQSRSHDNNGSRSTSGSRCAEPVRRRENARQSEDEVSAAGTSAVYEMAQNVVSCANSPGNTPVSEEDVISKVAEIMQVSTEIVAEWLQDLGLTVSDLTDAKNVAKMLQLALDAENVAELLTDSKFPGLYKAINEVMSEMAIKAEVGYVNQDVINALAEGMGGLDSTIEDGKVVVTNANGNSENGSNQQSATASSDALQAFEAEGDLTAEVTDATVFVADDATVELQAVTPAFGVELATAKTEQIVRQSVSQQPVNTTDVIEQIMNQVKVHSAGGQFSEIRMTLRPETLGDIVLRVITQNGIVTAQFEAESQRVKEALEADFNLLRDALEEQGVKFSELSVFVRQDGNERMGQFERARQNTRHRAESIEGVQEDETEEISYHSGVIDITA